MDTLVSLGVLAAFGWSVVSTILGAEDKEGFWLGYGVSPAGADTLYLEVASAVTTFLLAGRYVEARSKRSARGVLQALGKLAPTTVRVIRDGHEEVVPIAAAGRRPLPHQAGGADRDRRQGDRGLVGRRHLDDDR
jgi:Cu+-exporting ATPase